MVLNSVIFMLLSANVYFFYINHIDKIKALRNRKIIDFYIVYKIDLLTTIL